MKNIIRILITLVVLGGLTAAVAWKLGDNKKKIEADGKLTQVRTVEIPVKVTTMSTQTIQGGFEINGTFQPYKQLAVMSEAQGRITQLNVKDGSFVSEGAVILAVDNDLLKNQLDLARINLKKAENDVTRLKNLLGDGGVTQQQVDDAENGIENIKANIRGLEKQISMTYVRAPISGTVSGKTVEKGAFLAPAMKIMDIIDIRRLKMAAYLTDDEVLQIKKGQRVELRTDVYPNKAFVGVVNLIDVKADNAQRFLVEVELANPSATPLKAGMDGVAEFNTGRSASILALPRECIVGSARDAKVFVVENGVAKLRPVQLGNIYGDFAAVLSGLKAGETVVSSGQINLEDNMKVKVEE
ncbi:efflux RND transporter periplasmic adaptor subunit [Haliscomenobacter hydrossis]|uniref:Efflux transporter, RND family, MFP subunit n=1 Tax=Haliscomenobacter hydrossis (strain ATCC 27775 / DSM 1100 / LMG 10767 / O) TaxID=760192 RepID=F4KZY9_HALH1|nr:efflux RND transporter periplasmic adaptor subunit [Haliscomenobacter hydrossis]AEE51559.1 efflux transporter, RND family, MFP subunit [Haliscomenobacter hydrossis DSM 1100]